MVRADHKRVVSASWPEWFKLEFVQLKSVESHLKRWNEIYRTQKAPCETRIQQLKHVTDLSQCVNLLLGAEIVENLKTRPEYEANPHMVKSFVRSYVWAISNIWLQNRVKEATEIQPEYPVEVTKIGGVGDKLTNEESRPQNTKKVGVLLPNDNCFC